MINLVLESFIGSILEMAINFLRRGAFAIIRYEEDPDIEGFPMEYLVERVDKNTLEITPVDPTFDGSHLMSSIEYSPVAGALYYISRLETTIAVIKKHSTTEPFFNFYPKDKDFSYSFTLQGETFGEVFSKVTEIYREIDHEARPDDTQLLLEQYMNSI